MIRVSILRPARGMVYFFDQSEQRLRKYNPWVIQGIGRIMTRRWSTDHGWFPDLLVDLVPFAMSRAMRSLSRARIRHCGGAFLCLLLYCGLAHGQNSLRNVEPLDGTSDRNRVQGAGACSAVACHGSAAPRGRSDILQNEHTTWIADDPHALAYQALFSERSERMVRKLADSSTATPTPAHREERCLACHTTPRRPAELERTSWLNQDGVSCEACHGAAEKWLGPHTTDAWRVLTPEGKESSYGFRQITHFGDRAKVCAECHVGSPATAAGLTARDVNHDLIAAGHPRLNFEFSAFQDNMPKHWVDKGRNASPDHAALAWSVGQIVTTQAALELLLGRARSGGSTWPEFSEYGCFSCHHELADEPWRRNRRGDVSGVPPGSPHWGAWYLPMCEELAASDREAGMDPQGDWVQFRDAIRKLTGEMSKPSPDTGKVQEFVRTALEPLDRRFDAAASRTYSASDVERILNSLNAPDSWKHVRSWDHAAQRYLGLVPLRQAWTLLAPDRRDDQDRLRLELEDLRKRLRFDDTLDSPRREFNPTTLRDDR